MFDRGLIRQHAVLRRNAGRSGGELPARIGKLVRILADGRFRLEQGRFGVRLLLQQHILLGAECDNVVALQICGHPGLRILQLTYQRRNLAGDGCGEPADAGLSLFGRELVGHCNRLGILRRRSTGDHSADDAGP